MKLNINSILANGDASDWMLGEKKIIAFSPVLGIDNINNYGQVEYPDITNEGMQILKENYNSALYSIQKAGYYLE